MTRVELAGLCVCFMFFACGGLVGSMHTMLRLLSINHARLPWRAKLRVYHFFGMDETLIKRTQQLDRDAREVFGFILIAVLADFGGPGPWPKSKQAMDNVLAEAERRFQSKISQK